MSELKRCPFCGGEARLQRWHRKSDYYVICKECGCRTPLFQYQFDSKEERRKDAINTWNNRKPLERVVERLETEGKLADEERDRCTRENPFHFDTAKGYATGIYNAIEIIKEELM